MKELLKKRCHIYILIRKVIIRRKIHVKMKSFSPPFSTIELNKTYSHHSCWLLHKVLQWEISIGANVRSSHWRCSVKEGVLKSFEKITGKHLCQSRFFDKFAGLSLRFYRATPDNCFWNAGIEKTKREK